jgi:hypothetical protein
VSGCENDEYLYAVAARITSAIIDFCAERMGGQFHADELRQYVSLTVGSCAPGSADRVLRHLRQCGVIDYVCINRARSLYLLRSANVAHGLV